MKNKFQARQGDILFDQVDQLPKGLKKAESGVIAYGEVTGHSHRMATLDDCDIFVDKDGNMFLEARAESTVVHDEHGPITFPPGIFQITRQREYDAAEAARERRVAD